MGRWSHLDTDEERMPDGMTRIGYDADTQTYTFRDAADGSLWKGVPGSQYGRLFRVRPPTPLGSVTVDKVADGPEPEPVLNEGPWEFPDDPVPVRKESLVRKFIERWNSGVRRARAGSTGSSVMDGVSQVGSDAKEVDKEESTDAGGDGASPASSPTKNEKTVEETPAPASPPERSSSTIRVVKSTD